MEYYNDICKRDLERMAQIERNPDSMEGCSPTELNSPTPMNEEACIGFEGNKLLYIMYESYSMIYSIDSIHYH